MALPLFQGLAKGAVVAGFFPMRSEIDPRPLMQALVGHGFALALPCVTTTAGSISELARHEDTALVVPGQEVPAGQGLLVMEAMKMENELRSPRAGRLVDLVAREGQAVETGALLAVVE